MNSFCHNSFFCSLFCQCVGRSFFQNTATAFCNLFQSWKRHISISSLYQFISTIRVYISIERAALRTLTFRHCWLNTLLLPTQSTLMANLLLQPLDDSYKTRRKTCCFIGPFSCIRFFPSGSSLSSLSLNCLKSSHKDVLMVNVIASEVMLLPSFVFAFRLRLQFDDASGSATLVAAVAKLSLCSPPHMNGSLWCILAVFFFFFFMEVWLALAQSLTVRECCSRQGSPNINNSLLNAFMH